MPGNSFGQLFRLTTFGESHGEAIGCIIDGCPAGLAMDLDFIQRELDRRKPGQSRITTQRKETDTFQILSGVFEGKTLGTPIAIIIKNEDARSKDYSHLAGKFRPSHADFTYQEKYGIRDYRGGGRSSARETAMRVAAGGIAKLLLKQHQVSVTAYVSQVGEVKIQKQYQWVDFSQIEKTAVRCPDLEVAGKMISHIEEARKTGDTVGGIITCVIQHCPVGLGEPVFDKLNADLAKAMFSINAVKGFEIGSGFKAAEMRGSGHNDIFTSFSRKKEKEILTRTNFSGGIQGGISNGMDIYFNVAFKPVATLMQSQKTVNEKGQETEIKGKGRHDPCVVPRAVPIVEAMAALVLTDHLLRSKAAKM